MKIILLGLGEQSVGIAKYLHDSGIMDDEGITINEMIGVDFQEPKYRQQLEEYGVNIQIREAVQYVVTQLIDDSYLVISSLPAAENLKVFEHLTRINLGRTAVKYVDLGGGDNDITRKLYHLATASKIPAVFDVGVAPGLVSSIIAEENKEDSNIASVELFCGGIPQAPQFPHLHAVTFSPIGLFKEYVDIVEIRDGGELLKIPAMSEMERIFIPGYGIMEAEPTSGSLSLTPEFMEHIPNLSYKTLRYPGHWAWVRENILHQPDPIKALFECLPRIEPENPDALILRVDKTYNSGRQSSVTWEWKYDFDNEISAMAQITGYTVGAVALMMYQDKFKNQGYLMHDVDFQTLFNYIKVQNDQFKIIDEI